MKIKNLKISTGGIYVVLLYLEDAQKNGLKQGDRVSVSCGNKKTVCIVDTTNSQDWIVKGQIGIFDEATQKLCCKTGEVAKIDLVTKPRSVYHIGKKLRGERLTPAEIFEIVKDIVDKKLTDVEMTYFVSACYMHELSHEETVAFTEAMVATGKQLHFGDTVVADKHCIGGVAGNRTTCLVVPIIAAAGYTMPKTSSRSITSPAGTADTMEVLCNVTLTLEEMKRVIRRTKACMVWGGAMDVAPSDDTLIKVEHPMSLDPVGQMLASVLAKKKAAGATHCLIDIPVGLGAKVENRTRAVMLKKKFERVGKDIGMKVKVVLTDGSQPIGNGIGPALEARDLLWTLDRDPRGSTTLETKAIALAGELLQLLGEKKPFQLAKTLVESGAAAEKFREIMRAQGAKVDSADEIHIGAKKVVIRANRSGKIIHVDNRAISRIARLSGAPADSGAGVYLMHHVKDRVAKGDILYEVYADSGQKLKSAISYTRENNGFLIK